MEADEFVQARKVTRQLSEILLRRGDYVEIERLNRELLEIVRRAGQNNAEIEQHPDPATWVARALVEQAKYNDARQCYDQALTLAADRYPIERAHAIQGLASIDYYEGRSATAREGLSRALAIQETVDDRHGQAVTWHELGSIDFGEELYDAAELKFKKALQLVEGVAAQDRLARQDEQAIWHQLGSTQLMRKNFPEARKLLEKALNIANELGDRKAQAATIHQLGRADANQGNVGEAVQKLRAALEMRRELGDRMGEALSFRRLGDLASQLGQPELALRLSIVGFIINKAIAGDTGPDLQEVQRLATALGYSHERL